jgi:hypothetical protein
VTVEPKKPKPNRVPKPEAAKPETTRARTARIKAGNDAKREKSRQATAATVEATKQLAAAKKAQAKKGGKPVIDDRNPLWDNRFVSLGITHALFVEMLLAARRQVPDPMIAQATRVPAVRWRRWRQSALATAQLDLTGSFLPPEVALIEAIDVERARGVTMLTNSVFQESLAEGGGRLALEFLARRHPEHYSSTQRIEVTDKAQRVLEILQKVSGNSNQPVPEPVAEGEVPGP